MSKKRALRPVARSVSLLGLLAVLTLPSLVLAQNPASADKGSVERFHQPKGEREMTIEQLLQTYEKALNANRPCRLSAGLRDHQAERPVRNPRDPPRGRLGVGPHQLGWDDAYSRDR